MSFGQPIDHFTGYAAVLKSRVAVDKAPLLLIFLSIAKPDEPVEFLGYDIVQRAGTGAYDIVIPKRAFEKVKITLARYEQLQAAMKEFKTLGRFMQSMNSIAQSYVAVYKIGKNIDHLRSHVENCRLASINRIAIDLFGSDVIGKLDDDKRAFLGLTVKPLDGEW